MKTTLKLLITGLTLLTLATLNLKLSTAFAQGTAFSYQGRLNDGGSPATGIYDLRFTIYDAVTSGSVVAGPNTSSATGVTNGLFTVTLDFGSGVFTGSNRWVEIAARTNGAASFATLAPRQPISPVPYAIMANSASNLLGTLPTAQLTGTFTGNGSGLTLVNANTLNGQLGAFYQNAANLNTGTIPLAQLPGAVMTNGEAGIVQLNNDLYLSGMNVAGLGYRNYFDGFSVGGPLLWGYTGGALGTVVPDEVSLTWDYQGNVWISNNLSVASINLRSGTANAGIIYLSGVSFIHGYGNNNFFAGPLAGNMTMTGAGNNTGIGYLALFSNTTGSNNVANGAAALNWNSTGNNNTANGYWALLKNTSGSYNTANGYNALMWNISGAFNTGDGQQALALNNTGTNNIAVGYQAGYNISGNNNIDIGNPGVSSDNNIIRIGSGQTQTFIAGVINGNGSGLTSLNPASLSAGTANISISGSAATAVNGVVTIGSYADPGWITSLSGAKISGNISGNAVTATTANNFSGSLAGGVTGTQGATVVSTVGGSTAVNIHAAEQLANAATSAATASTIVKRDGSGNFTSTSITLNGNLNLPATTSSAGIIYSGGSPFIHAFGNANFFAGSGAGNMTMTGPGDNTGIGWEALFANTTGSNNVANGATSLTWNSTGNNNTANGYQALFSNTGGSYNTANGYNALFWNISGNFNTGDGQQALALNSTGTNNIALGYQAGYNIQNNNNIDIGNPGVLSDNNIIRIGSGQTSTYLAGNSVHVPGMLRLGSETNTASGPSYPSDGLIIRRISSTSQTVSNLVARTDALMLTRDGTAAGLAMNYSIVGTSYQNIVAIGIDNTGVQHIYRNTLTSGTGGTLYMFVNSQHIVHYDVSFGNVYNGGHTCHVILDRYDDGGSTSDNYMIGYLTSTYNQ